MKKVYKTLSQRLPKSFNGKAWVYETTHKRVEVMYLGDRYAMVRNPKCAPFVVFVSELSDMEPPNAK